MLLLLWFFLLLNFLSFPSKGDGSPPREHTEAPDFQNCLQLTSTYPRGRCSTSKMKFDWNWSCRVPSAVSNNNHDNLAYCKLKKAAISNQQVRDCWLTNTCWVPDAKRRGPGIFGGTGVPSSGKNVVNPPPIDTCPRFWTKACHPPAEVRPWKFEKFKYIFVSNLTTFNLINNLKSCISCLNSKKWPNFALGFSQIFFASPPIRLRPLRGPTGTNNFESPPIKNLGKTLGPLKVLTLEGGVFEKMATNFPGKIEFIWFSMRLTHNSHVKKWVLKFLRSERGAQNFFVMKSIKPVRST